jgi:hypothetical protein
MKTWDDEIARTSLQHRSKQRLRRLFGFQTGTPFATSCYGCKSYKKKAQTVSLCPAEKSGRMVIQGTHIRKEKRDVRKAGTNSSGSSIAHLVVFEVQLLQTSILAAKKINKISYINKADSAQYPNEKIRVREREKQM